MRENGKDSCSFAVRLLLGFMLCILSPFLSQFSFLCNSATMIPLPPFPFYLSLFWSLLFPKCSCPGIWPPSHRHFAPHLWPSTVCLSLFPLSAVCLSFVLALSSYIYVPLHSLLWCPSVFTCSLLCCSVSSGWCLTSVYVCLGIVFIPNYNISCTVYYIAFLAYKIYDQYEYCEPVPMAFTYADILSHLWKDCVTHFLSSCKFIQKCLLKTEEEENKAMLAVEFTDKAVSSCHCTKFIQDCESQFSFYLEYYDC